jgi:hypothetical protein
LVHGGPTVTVAKVLARVGAHDHCG